MGCLGRRFFFPGNGFGFVLIAVSAAAAVEPLTVRKASPGRAPVRRLAGDGQRPFTADPMRDRDEWAAVEPFRWAPVDQDAHLAEDADRAGQPGVPMRIGVNRPVPGTVLSSITDGQWIDGRSQRSWRMKLEDPGSFGLRIHFSRFELPNGGSVLIRGSGEGSPLEYREKGPRDEGSFWSATLFGEIAYLEYEGPRHPAPIIEIDQISSLYRDPEAPIAAIAGDEGGVAGGLLPCHVDVNCQPVDSVARDSVGRMIFTVPGQGTYLCTGGLLSDVDDNTFAGYFLTANHCISSQAAATTLDVYWFYQSNSCNGSVPNLGSRPRSDGATLLVTSAQSDFTLLRLADDPAAGQGFAAWTTGVPAVNDQVIGIHHPGGSFKRHAKGPVTTSSPICGGLPLARFVYNDWTPGLGVTEDGSSGSPLFNSNWEVIGQLFGVCYFSTPDCANPSQYNNVYGRFSFSYPSMSAFLNTVTPDDAYENNDESATAAAIDPGSYDLTLVDFVDYFSLTVLVASEVTVAMTYTDADMDVEFRLLDDEGGTIDFDFVDDGNMSVSAIVVPGTYRVQISKIRGWGGDYSLNVASVLSSCTVPDAAVEQDPPTPKNRFASFTPGNPGLNTAIRVKLTSLHHPDPAIAGSPSFAAFEGASRWVGPPQTHADPGGSPASFSAAPLQCDPYFTDWGSVGLLHVYGPAILPDSVYDIQIIEENCSLTNEGNFSTPLTVTTRRRGDVISPFNPPSTSQPNFADITALVNKFVGIVGAPRLVEAKLQPDLVEPGAAISFLDISNGVDGFRGLPYVFAGPTSCP